MVRFLAEHDTNHDDFVSFTTHGYVEVDAYFDFQSKICCAKRRESRTRHILVHRIQSAQHR